MRMCILLVHQGGPSATARVLPSHLACFSAWTGEKGRNAGGSTCAGFALQLNVSFKSLSILETAQDAPRGGMLPSHPC